MPSTFGIFKKKVGRISFSKKKKRKKKKSPLLTISLVTHTGCFAFPFINKANTESESHSHSHTPLLFSVLPSRARANTWTHSNTESMKRAIHFVLLLFLSLLLHSYAEEAFDVRQHFSTVTRSLSLSLDHALIVKIWN